MPALTPWPRFNQLADWTTDADGTDENAANNCGPESVAMCLKYLTGVELPADFIKDATYGPTYTGYTHDHRLAEFLRRRCEVPVEMRRGNAQTQLRPVVESAIDAGYPVIVLYFWDIKKPETGHFAPVIGYDADGCTRLNPWGGAVEWWNWEKFEAWQKLGHCLVLQRTRDAALGARDLEAVSVRQAALWLLAEAETAGYALPGAGGA